MSQILQRRFKTTCMYLRNHGAATRSDPPRDHVTPWRPALGLDAVSGRPGRSADAADVSLICLVKMQSGSPQTIPRVLACLVFGCPCLMRELGV